MDAQVLQLLLRLRDPERVHVVQHLKPREFEHWLRQTGRAFPDLLAEAEGFGHGEGGADGEVEVFLPGGASERMEPRRRVRTLYTRPRTSGVAWIVQLYIASRMRGDQFEESGADGFAHRGYEFAYQPARFECCEGIGLFP